MDGRLIDLGLEPVELGPGQRTRLDEQGFLILEDMIAPAWLEELRQAFEAICEREGKDAGKEVAQVQGVRRLAARPAAPLQAALRLERRARRRHLPRGQLHVDARRHERRQRSHPHRARQPPVPRRRGREVSDRLAPYPGEALMEAPAGSVGVFNGSAWHSCTRNRSGAPRRLLHCAFIAR